MKTLVKIAAVTSLMTLSPSAASAFPGGNPGNVPYDGLCAMGNPDGSGAFFTKIPCWAQAIAIFAYGG